MKITVFILSLLVCLSALGAEPEVIYPKIKIIRSAEWYGEQASLWKEKIDHKKTDQFSWLNYYLASRFARVDQHTLDAMVKSMEAAIPNSYELLIVKGFQQEYSAQSIGAFQSAFQMNPHQTASYAPLVLGYEILGDLNKRKEFSERLLKSDLLSSSLLNYSYNVLMSLESGAVLITEGENTTIPLFVLQDVMNVRQDISILSIDLMTNEDYRLRKLAENKLNDAAVAGKSIEEIVAQFPSQNPAATIYYTLTMPGEDIRSIKDQLFVVGLASQFSNKRIDNLSRIRENLEKKFLLDYLTVDFNGESEFATGKILSANYLVPMLMLHEYYLESNQTEKAKDLEVLINKIAAESGKSLWVQNFLNRSVADLVPYIPSNTLNIKALEGGQKKISATLYGGAYEITNQDYNVFLNYLVENKLNEQYERFKFDLSRYDEPALSFMKSYSAAWIPSKKEKYYTNFPAVNVSHEAATAFCEWLTEQYNGAADRKHKKVKFRLPTLKEWQIAALGYPKFTSWELDENMVEVGVPKNSTDELTKDSRMVLVKDNDIQYPWFKSYNYRNKVLNSHGCALGNFKFPDSVKPCVPRQKTGPDGFALMAPVGAYFPNGMGLSDVVGNVAEMIDEKGKACGGSWNQAPEESTIHSVQTYSNPESFIGFRVFMEVIEP